MDTLTRDNWYEIIRGDNTDSNAILRCKLLDCPKITLTKTNRRRHLKRRHPEVYKYLYDESYTGGVGGNSNKPVVAVREGHKDEKKDLQKVVESNDYLNTPLPHTGWLPEPKPKPKANRDEPIDGNSKKINTEGNTSPATTFHYPTQQVTIDEILGCAIREQQEREERREREEQRREAERRQKILLAQQQEYTEQRNNKIKQLEASNQALKKMIGNAKKGDDDKLLRQVADLQSKNLQLEKELIKTAIELEQIRDRGEDIEKNYKKANKKEKQKILRMANNNPALMKYIEACSKACDECYKSVKSDKMRVNKLNEELNARMAALEKRMNTMDKRHDRLEEEQKDVKKQQAINKQIITNLGKKIEFLEKELSKYVKKHPEVMENITEKEDVNETPNNKEATKTIVGGSYEETMENIANKMRLAKNGSVKKSNTSKIIKETRNQWKNNKDIIYQYLDKLPKRKNKVGLTIKRVELGKVIMKELKQLEVKA